MAARKENIEDYIEPKTQVSMKYMQVAVPESLYREVKASLKRRDVTGQEWLMASLKMLVTSEAKKSK